MPPVLRLWQGGGQAGGSQVEEPERPPVFSKPSAARTSPVLVLRPKAKDNPDGFTYHSGTTAMVTETTDFVEVSDGPPGSGLSVGERRAHDGTWSEKFIHQRGTEPGAGKGDKGTGKGKGHGGSARGPRDFGKRMGQSTALGQRWKESWERETVAGGAVSTRVERHVQEVDDVAAADADVRQEWDEDEEAFEVVEATGSSASSSTDPAPAAPAAGGDTVLRSRRWVQRGTDRKTGRTWSRVVVRRRIRKEDEVLSESEEECEEASPDGEKRGSFRHRVGRSLETREWGQQPNGNRWSSSYKLQTLVGPQGEICGRESVSKWYDNGEEEQTEEWQTLDEFEAGERPSPTARPGSPGSHAQRLRLRRRIRSGRKDGRSRGGNETEWHERWEETEVPVEGILQLSKKSLEKWWREHACNNAWGEHRTEHSAVAGAAGRVEERKWYDNGRERQDESWTTRADGSAEGRKEGCRDGQTWGERWTRTCEEGDGNQVVEKWHDDGLGTKVTSKEDKHWSGSKVEWHREELGEVVGQNETWTVKSGGNAEGDEWFEALKQRQAEKSAEKRGRNAVGDEWREAWTEEFDAEGVRVRQSAQKEGSNARGDTWYEEWIEEQERRKRALKRGSDASGSAWQEEWGEEAKEDGSGSKWTSKHANDGAGNHWGDNWGDEWGSDGQGGKRWVEKWDNKGHSEKHCHGTAGRPEH